MFRGLGASREAATGTPEIPVTDPGQSPSSPTSEKNMKNKYFQFRCQIWLELAKTSSGVEQHSMTFTRRWGRLYVVMIFRLMFNTCSLPLMFCVRVSKDDLTPIFISGWVHLSVHISFSSLNHPTGFHYGNFHSRCQNQISKNQHLWYRLFVCA
jgi:hypothetical protein